MHRRRRITALGLVLGLALGAPGTALGAPAGRTGAAPAAVRPTGTPSAAQPSAALPATVTLITGDRVTVARGRATVRPGPGREKVRFLVRRDHGHLSVLPTDAVPLIRSGRVDRRLFDVTGLVDARYDDAHRDTVPLLVAYTPGTARRATAPLPGTTVTRDLPAIGGAAVTAGKSSAGTVWAALGGGDGRARLGAAGDVERVWLDSRRAVTLDHSVPQIGAPAAWAAGWTGRGVKVAVLDTGVDAHHPDLAGKVAQARNFTEAPDARDTVGHGTHVASTIAGSGAASGGRYKGVAPDATLLDGKVCEDFGCTDSAILAGMQWAAVDQHATVVNMSLSGMDTPDVDPLELAVQTLTAQTGTLFVTAAGNDGADGSVGSPASADAALAVGAVDRNDELADFSSRGPRVDDDAIKPDLTAPGVDIVAARSADGQIGDPVGERYVALSGTSMATPHVAGSVALLAQEHPGWKAGQFKATLMAAARPHPRQTAYEQGAGRVDVARAIGQQLTSEPASVSFGRALWPHGDDAPITRTVTWRNAGPAPVTVDLALEVAGPGGRVAPAGMFTLGATRLTVPAGGTAATTVTADTRLGVDGYWTGRVVARSGAAVAVTPLAVHREVESYTLTLTHLGRDGAPFGDFDTTLIGLDRNLVRDVFGSDGVVQLRLPRGRYGLSSVFFESTPDGEPGGLAQLVRPELVVDHDQALTVDLRVARPVRMTVPRADAEVALVDLGVEFTTDDGTFGIGLVSFGTFDGLATGQLGDPVPGDRFRSTFNSQWADLAVASSPYLYALSEQVPGRLPSGFVRDYRPADLATVTQRFRGGYPGLEAERSVWSDVGGWAIALPTAVPGSRVEHYSTTVGWASELLFGVRDPDGWLDGRAVLDADPRSYRPGSTGQDTWNAAPYGPSFPAPAWPGQGVTRTRDGITVDLPLHSDAAGHPGASVTDRARTTLLRNGRLVGDSDRAGYVEFPVSPTAATFVLTVSAARSFTDLSTEIESSWTFRSGHVPTRQPVRLPVSAIGFAPPLAVDNSAPAGRALTVPVRVRPQPGAPAATVRKLTVDASYDGGRTWQPADVAAGSGSGWTATLHHPAGTGYASLRATAWLSDGGVTSTRIIQAYRLR